MFAPVTPPLTRSKEIYVQLLASNGGNGQIGKHHKGLLRQAGFVGITTSATYEVYSSDKAVRHQEQTLAQAWTENTLVEQVTRNGYASLEEVQRISRAWQEWGANPDAFFADAWFAALGWKE
ncbi:MAG: hypothetical protein R2932_44550 [Caldilineaceae bacterium]